MLFVVCHFDKLSKSDAGFNGTRIWRIGVDFKWNADDADLVDWRGLVLFYFLSVIICYIRFIRVHFFGTLITNGISCCT